AESKKKSWFSNLFSWMKRKPAPPKALPLNAVGRVFVFNADQKYAVIESGGASSLAPGTPLAVLADGNIKARLVVSSQSRPPFLIADWRSGHPQKDDPVYIVQE
ncbi:MAG TPA: hypothetical protein VIS74_00425, partial [Chthoniobacterales bacterium]